MEEERRLCYVAMTRAKEKLTLTNTRQRTLYGRTSPAMPSRFLKEIPEENMEWLGKPNPSRRRPTGRGSGSVLPLRLRYVPVGRSRSDLQRLRPLRRCGLAPQHPLRP